MLARLGADRDGVLRLLILVPRGDASARQVAEQFADTARGDRIRVEATVTEIEVVPGAQPIVPDGTAGVLVVVSLGSRNAWELVAISEACSDAGHEILGTVLAREVHLAAWAEAEAGREAAH